MDNLTIDTVYGIMITQEKPDFSSYNYLPLDICFSDYNSFYLEASDKELKDKRIVYLSIFLNTIVEDCFNDIKEMFSNYALELYPVCYIKEGILPTTEACPFKRKGYLIAEKAECDTALYTIKIDLTKLRKTFSKYFVSLIIFMFFRLYSPGEHYKDFSLIINNKNIPPILKPIYINNTVGASRHLVDNSKYLSLDDLKKLNDYKKINKLFSGKFSYLTSYINNNTYSGKDNKVKLSLRETLSLHTSLFLQVIREQIEPKVTIEDLIKRKEATK